MLFTCLIDEEGLPAFLAAVLLVIRLDGVEASVLGCCGELRWGFVGVWGLEWWSELESIPVQG